MSSSSEIFHKLRFVTSNRLKAAFLARYVPGIEQVELDLVEPQSDSVETVVRYKGLQAYQQLQQPVVVEDTGFFIDGLGGFPGPQARYVLSTIGVDGLLRLSAALPDRTCRFVNALVYVTGPDDLHLFTDSNEGRLALTVSGQPADDHWTELTRVFIPNGADVTLAEAPERVQQWADESVFAQFGRWLKR